MAKSEIRVGDYGSKLKDTIKDQDDAIVDLSVAAGPWTILYKIEKPDGDLLSKTGVLQTDGTDGKVQYTIESGVLDQPGTWQYQVYVTKTGIELKSDIGNFRVWPNLPG